MFNNQAFSSPVHFTLCVLAVCGKSPVVFDHLLFLESCNEKHAPCTVPQQVVKAGKACGESGGVRKWVNKFGGNWIETIFTDGNMINLGRTDTHTHTIVICSMWLVYLHVICLSSSVFVVRFWVWVWPRKAELKYIQFWRRIREKDFPKPTTTPEEQPALVMTDTSIIYLPRECARVHVCMFVCFVCATRQYRFGFIHSSQQQERYWTGPPPSSRAFILFVYEFLRFSEQWNDWFSSRNFTWTAAAVVWKNARYNLWDALRNQMDEEKWFTCLAWFAGCKCSLVWK